jgi:hypothetical protein
VEISSLFTYPTQHVLTWKCDVFTPFDNGANKYRLIGRKGENEIYACAITEKQICNTTGIGNV